MLITTAVVAPRAAADPLGPGDFALSESDLPPFLAAFLIESLLFGVHATLFFVCVRILIGRRKSTVRMAMLTAVVAMFALATVDVAISWYTVLRRTSFLYKGTTTRLQKAIHPKFIIHLINKLTWKAPIIFSAIADFLLLTRCYVVWGNRKSVLFVGGFGLIVGTLCGIITGALPRISNLIWIYILIVLGFNFILTAMTAGRIMWIAKEVRKALGPQMASYYQFSAGILVESGLIYTVSTLLLIILAKSIYIVVAAAIVLRVVCIVPILIIVQITVGQSMEDVKPTVTRLQGGTQQVVLDTMINEGYDAEGEGSREQFEDEIMEHRTSIELSTITPKS